MYLNKETISDILCDLYDIRNMAILEGFGNLPKIMKAQKQLYLIA